MVCIHNTRQFGRVCTPFGRRCVFDTYSHKEKRDALDIPNIKGVNGQLCRPSLEKLKVRVHPSGFDGSKTHTTNDQKSFESQKTNTIGLFNTSVNKKKVKPGSYVKKQKNAYYYNLILLTNKIDKNTVVPSKHKIKKEVNDAFSVGVTVWLIQGTPLERLFPKWSTNKQQLFTTPKKHENLLVEKLSKISHLNRVLFANSNSSLGPNGNGETNPLFYFSTLFKPFGRSTFFPYSKSFLCYWLLPFVGFVSTFSQQTDSNNFLRSPLTVSFFETLGSTSPTTNDFFQVFNLTNTTYSTIRTNPENLLAYFSQPLNGSGTNLKVYDKQINSMKITNMRSTERHPTVVSSYLSTMNKNDSLDGFSTKSCLLYLNCLDTCLKQLDNSETSSPKLYNEYHRLFDTTLFSTKYLHFNTPTNINLTTDNKGLFAHRTLLSAKLNSKVSFRTTVRPLNLLTKQSFDTNVTNGPHIVQSPLFLVRKLERSIPIVVRTCTYNNVEPGRGSSLPFVSSKELSTDHKTFSPSDRGCQKVLSSFSPMVSFLKSSQLLDKFIESNLLSPTPDAFRPNRDDKSPYGHLSALNKGPNIKGNRSSSSFGPSNTINSTIEDRSLSESIFVQESTQPNSARMSLRHINALRAFTHDKINSNNNKTVYKHPNLILQLFEDLFSYELPRRDRTVGFSNLPLLATPERPLFIPRDVDWEVSKVNPFSSKRNLINEDGRKTSSFVSQSKLNRKNLYKAIWLSTVTSIHQQINDRSDALRATPPMSEGLSLETRHLSNLTHPILMSNKTNTVTPNTSLYFLNIYGPSIKMYHQYNSSSFGQSNTQQNSTVKNLISTSILTIQPSPTSQIQPTVSRLQQEVKSLPYNYTPNLGEQLCTYLNRFAFSFWSSSGGSYPFFSFLQQPFVILNRPQVTLKSTKDVSSFGPNHLKSLESLSEENQMPKELSLKPTVKETLLKNINVEFGSEADIDLLTKEKCRNVCVARKGDTSTPVSYGHRRLCVVDTSTPEGRSTVTPRKKVMKLEKLLRSYFSIKGSTQMSIGRLRYKDYKRNTKKLAIYPNDGLLGAPENLYLTTEPLKIPKFKNGYNSVWVKDRPLYDGQSNQSKVTTSGSLRVKNYKKTAPLLSLVKHKMINFFNNEKLIKNFNKKNNHLILNTHIYKTKRKKTKLFLSGTSYNIGPRMLIKNRSFIQLAEQQLNDQLVDLNKKENLIVSIPNKSKSNSNNQVEKSIIKKRQSIQKKRRITKLKKKTRRRKKRLRFYPRPIWLRYRFYSTTFGRRFAVKNINHGLQPSTFLPHSLVPMKLSDTSDKRLRLFSFKEKYATPNVYIGQNADVTKTNCPKDVTPTIDSIDEKFNTNFIKTLLWGQFDGNTVNKRLSNTDKLTTSQEVLSRETLQPGAIKGTIHYWELLKNSRHLIHSFLGGITEPIQNIKSVGVTSWAMPNSQSDMTKSKRHNISWSEERESPLYSLWQTANYLSEYNQVASKRLQLYISQVGLSGRQKDITTSQNLTSTTGTYNSLFKYRSSHIKKKFPSERKTKNTLRGGYSLENDKTTDKSLAENIVLAVNNLLLLKTESPFGISSLRYNNLSRLRLYWAYSKINESSPESFNKRLQIWTIASKARQQTKDNKTKKLFKQIKNVIGGFFNTSTSFGYTRPFIKESLQEPLFGSDILTQNTSNTVDNNNPGIFWNPVMLSNAIYKTRLKQVKKINLIGENFKGTPNSSTSQGNVEPIKKPELKRGYKSSTQKASTEPEYGFSKITGKKAYWWVESKLIDTDSFRPFSADRRSYISNISNISNIKSLSPSSSGIEISSLLFHFCSFVTLISISQIRGLLKFSIICFTKILSNTQFLTITESLKGPKDRSDTQLGLSLNTTSYITKLPDISVIPDPNDKKKIKYPKDLRGLRSVKTGIKQPTLINNTYITSPSATLVNKGVLKRLFNRHNIRFYFSKKSDSFLYVIHNLLKENEGPREFNLNTGGKTSFLNNTNIIRAPYNNFNNLKGSSDTTTLENSNLLPSRRRPVGPDEKGVPFYYYIRTLIKKPIYFYKKTIIRNDKVTLEKREDQRLSSKLDVSPTLTKPTLYNQYKATSLLYGLILLNSIGTKLNTLYSGTKKGIGFTQKRINQILEVTLRSFYTFFEKPGILIVDWIAYVFLVEWASDISNTLPISLDTKVLGSPISKMTRTIYGLNILANLESSLLTNDIRFLNGVTGTLGDLQFTLGPPDLGTSLHIHKTSVINVGTNWSDMNSLSLYGIKKTNLGIKTDFNEIPLNFVFLNLLSTFFKRRIFHLYEIFLNQFYQPDTDLLVRHQKGSIFWDIWGDFLIKIAEESNINIPELTNLKEEQIQLLDKVMETSTEKESSDSSTGKGYSDGSKDEKVTLRRPLIGTYITSLLRNGERKGIYKSWGHLRSRSYNSNGHQSANNSSDSFYRPSFMSTIQNQDWSYEKLFQLNVKSSDTWGSQQFLSYAYGKKETELFIDLFPPQSLGSEGHGPIGKPNFVSQQGDSIGALICQVFSGILTKQISKNVLVIGSPGIEKTLLVQAIAGETELKIISDNAKRYALVYRGVAIGIKLLRDVFDSLSLQAPCLFLISDIHTIGERRPLLISDDENTTNISGRAQNVEIHEKNQVLYQYSKHVVTHYKKPYKGDFSLLIPSNHFCFDFFYSKDLRGGADGQGIWKTSSSRRLTLSSPLIINERQHIMNSENQNPTTEGRPERNYTSDDQWSRVLHTTSTHISPSRMTSPFSGSTTRGSKDNNDKKFNKNQNVFEIPWSSTLSENSSQISKASYSIRVKVALLADMALSSLSVKLDIITDLLVIIDSVKGNRGFVVFATTHIPFVLDPALRRPGRLDETISLGGFGVPMFTNVKPSSFWEIFKYKGQFLHTFSKKAGLQSIGSTLDFYLVEQNGPLANPLYNQTSLARAAVSFIKNKNIQKMTYSSFGQSHLTDLSIRNVKNQPNGKGISSLFNKFATNSPLYTNTLQSNPKQKLNHVCVARKGDTSTTEGRLRLLNNDNNKVIFDQVISVIESPGKPSALQSDVPTLGKRTIIKILSKAYFNASFMLYNYLLDRTSQNLTNVGQNVPSTFERKPVTGALASSQSYSSNIAFFDYPLFNFPAGDVASWYLYSSPQHLKMKISLLISVRYAGEFLLKTNTLMSHRESISLSDQSLRYMLTNTVTWQSLTTLVLSYIHKRIIYNKNLFVLKLFDFSNHSSLTSLPSPPVSSILLPTKRFFNYKRSFSYYANKAEYSPGGGISLMEKIQIHQQQRLVKNLYGVPVKESFKSEILFKTPPRTPEGRRCVALSGDTSSNKEFSILQKSRNSYPSDVRSDGRKTEMENMGLRMSFDSDQRLTSFSNASFMIGNINASTLQKTNSLFWFVKNRVLKRHKNYLTNQWWNGQLSEHNTETTRPTSGDIDWRYTFINSVGDILLDFPDTEQYYNPRNRRWVLRSQADVFIDQFMKSTQSSSEIYSYFIFSSLLYAFNICEQNREVLDYYVFHLSQNRRDSEGGFINSNFNELSRLMLLKRFFPECS